MFDKKMETEAIPERVYSLCQILSAGSMSEKDIRAMVEITGKPIFGKIRDAAIQLDLVALNDDTKTMELLVDKKHIENMFSFRRFINSNIDKLSAGQFYRTVQTYMMNSQELFEIDKELQNVSKIVRILNDMDASLFLDEDNMRAWRFWASFLGFGYLHDMFFMPNVAVFLEDCISSSNIEKNKVYTMDEFIEFLYPSIQICISTDDKLSRRLNFAVSNAFRTLVDLSVIELQTVNDRKDEWNMYDIPLHKTKSTITDVVYKGGRM